MNKDIQTKYEIAKDIAMRFDNWKALDTFFEELLEGKFQGFLDKPSRVYTDYIDLSTQEED